jgi:hypothetical protein
MTRKIWTLEDVQAVRADLESGRRGPFEVLDITIQIYSDNMPAIVTGEISTNDANRITHELVRIQKEVESKLKAAKKPG